MYLPGLVAAVALVTGIDGYLKSLHWRLLPSPKHEVIVTFSVAEKHFVWLQLGCLYHIRKAEL
jgi:hypothetical protein